MGQKSGDRLFSRNSTRSNDHESKIKSPILGPLIERPLGKYCFSFRQCALVASHFPNSSPNSDVLVLLLQACLPSTTSNWDFPRGPNSTGNYGTEITHISLGHTPTGSYSRKGVLLPSRCLLESPFLEPLLRTLLRTLLPIKTHCKTPSKNPS